MPLGQGWWYDRRQHRYHVIDEHATDAVLHPRRFRFQAVSRLNPVRDRETIVRHVAAQGFIRIRLWKGHLGFEFHDDTDGALKVLRRFLRRHEIGPVVVITIADLSTDSRIEVSAAVVMTVASAMELGLYSKKPRRFP